MTDKELELRNQLDTLEKKANELREVSAFIQSADYKKFIEDRYINQHGKKLVDLLAYVTEDKKETLYAELTGISKLNCFFSAEMRALEVVLNEIKEINEHLDSGYFDSVAIEE